MNLDGKYIILKNRQLIPILEEIYKLGYRWDDKDNTEFSYYLKEEYKTELIIVFWPNKKLAHCNDLNYIVDKYGINSEIKIGVFSRENKLKRILK